MRYVDDLTGMHKTRLENFSDGVFAIAVTLLILGVKIPDTKNFNNTKLNHSLWSSIPHLATFAFSFLVIGVFWVAHNRIFSFVKILDSTLLWLNIVYLLFVAVIPYPRRPSFGKPLFAKRYPYLCDHPLHHRDDALCVAGIYIA